MLHPKRQILLLLISTLICCTLAEDNWVWSKKGGDRSYREDKIDRSVIEFDKNRHDALERSEREREPTTKRPSANTQSDDIDDYTDTEANNLGTRNYSPYGGNGYNAGFNSFPQNINGGFGGGGGSAANGILVGPGGPTGIIGRPPQSFGAGNGGFGIDGTGAAGGFPGQSQFGQGAGFNPNFNPGYQAGFPAGQAGFPGAIAQAGLNNGIGQYPGAQYGANAVGAGGQFGQIPGAQYPQYPAGQFPGNQFIGGQYPGAQYGGAGQYPIGTPQYTEGYGLAYQQGYPNNGLGGLPFNSYPNAFGPGFDAYDNTKRKLQVEGKSAASVQSLDAGSKSVDDKLGKKL